ncbi:MAG: hypothetical protein N4A40_15120 [Tissierellales bacterium]|jgi:hypothetical protein|nr:hypothetical protein [Tissierellales bacterium]
MGKAYLKDLPNIYEYLIENLSKRVTQVINEGFPKVVGSFHSSNSLTLKSIAICDYIINKDIACMKNRLYNASISGLKSMQWYDTQIGLRHISNSLSLSKFHLLEFAIISENTEAIFEVAHALGGRGKLDSAEIGKETYHLGYALKYIVLDDYENASNHLEFFSGRDPLNFITIHADILSAIIAKNSDLVNECIDKLIIKYKRLRGHNNTPAEFLCLSAISLAKLAKMKNLEIHIDHALAPKTIIDSSDVNYELIDILK